MPGPEIGASLAERASTEGVAQTDAARLAGRDAVDLGRASSHQGGGDDGAVREESV
jgi:hypothetical protein